ncbi:hypothetical protein N658DRAFT_562147 [Parathielavia hyrcaniae]|uniref:Uncharacterized protein n=1 Tax=Parathielavia hyrcaniae TaxID=113614 RepID=A0AAN6PS21_9PEZI|nr:hypothetical protein N658DRAFT_562147 [Parathielavia hyrcaniae]
MSSSSIFSSVRTSRRGRNNVATSHGTSSNNRALQSLRASRLHCADGSGDTKMPPKDVIEISSDDGSDSDDESDSGDESGKQMIRPNDKPPKHPVRRLPRGLANLWRQTGPLG